MKCSFQDIFADICVNSDISNVWVLDANHTDYFKWRDSSLPAVSRIADAEKICVAAAAQAELDNNTGVCVFPTASALLESLSALYELNRSRVSLLVACVVDDYDMTPESMFLPLLRNCDLFVQVLTESNQSARMILHSLQYAVAENRVAILLISRHLLSVEAGYEKNKRIKSYKSDPVILPPQNKLEELADNLNQYEKITILCGKQCGEAVAEVNALSGLLLSPVVFNPGIRAAVGVHMEYAVGVYGHWAQPAAYEAVGDSQLLLLLDYSQKNFCEFGDKVKIIQISPFALSGVDQQQTKHVYRGDIKNTLKYLIPLIRQKQDSSFVDGLMQKHREHERLLADKSGPVPLLLHDLAQLLNRKLDQNSSLCAEGYSAFFFQNVLVDTDARRFICHLDDLQGHGNAVFMTLGMLSSGSLSQAVGILDSNSLLSQISCLLPLADPAYNIKIIAFNKQREKGESPLSNLCKAMGIAYYQLNGSPDVVVGVEHWLHYNHSSVLEICVDLPDNLLVEVPSYRYGPIPDDLFKKVLDSLYKLKTGALFCQGNTISKSVLDAAHDIPINPLYSARNVFYAAVGAENQEDKIAVCVASNLHEVLSMVPGIYETKRHHLPILFLVFINTMECKQRVIKESFVLHRVVNILSGYHQIADLKKDLNLILGEAIAEAHQIRNIGTVIFQNIYELKEEPTCSEVFDSPYIRSIEYPAEDKMNMLARAIDQAHNPVIFAGAGCINAAPEVMELVKKIQAPLGWTFRSKDLFDENPYPLGMPGLLSSEGLELALKKCDLLLLLGIDFPFENKISKSATIIQVDINPANLGLTHAVDIGLVGDVKYTIRQLLPLITEKAQAGAFVTECKDKYIKEYDSYLKAIEEKQKKLDAIIFEGVIERINQTAPGNAWITADMVIPWYLSAMILKSRGTRRFFSTGDNLYSCNSTAFSMGADLVNNEVPKIVITTNISFRKQIDNLRTAVRKKTNLKIFVLHMWDESPAIAYSRLFGSDESKGITITALDEMYQKLPLVFNIPGFVVVDIYIAKTSLIRVPPLIPLLVNKHRAILENLYVENGKNIYMQIFGLLPSELKDDDWQ
ncbi:MAG: hypothetical protein RR346_05510 [Bacteroidales bacterium]